MKLQKQLTLYEHKSEIYKQKLEKTISRIESCPSLPWADLVCKTCGEKLTEHPFKLSCLSNFCQDDECIKNRLRIRRMQFRDFRIRSKKLFNFVIGFKDIDPENLTREKRNLYDKVLRFILKDVLKTYGRFYFIAERDINKSKSNEGFIRFHYHIGTLPLKDFRFFDTCLNRACLRASEKFSIDVSISLGKFQSRGSVLSYFAKRSVGVFGHDRTGETKFGFSDFMHYEDYHNVFYKTKSWFSNLKHIRREATEFIAMLNNIPAKCPNCRVQTKKNMRVVTLDTQIVVPPPPDIKSYPNLHIPVVKISVGTLQ
jgi:hypothetical protein